MVAKSSQGFRENRKQLLRLVHLAALITGTSNQRLGGEVRWIELAQFGTVGDGRIRFFGHGRKFQLVGLLRHAATVRLYEYTPFEEHHHDRPGSTSM